MEIVNCKTAGIDLDFILGQIEFFNKLGYTKKSIFKKNLELVVLDNQELLMTQGDEPDYLYYVYSGRLAAYKENGDWKKSIVGYIKHGELIGELAIITELPRLTSVRALRKCLLIRFPNSIIQGLLKNSPELMLYMSSLISKRMKQMVFNHTTSDFVDSKAEIMVVISAGKSKSTHEFLHVFYPVLSSYQNCCTFNENSFNFLMNKESLVIKKTALNDYIRHSFVLANLENNCPLIILICDHQISDWSLFCLQNADCFLFISEEHTSDELNDIENYIYQNKESFETVNKKMIMIHPDATSFPKDTKEWLIHRDISFVQHVCIQKTETLHQLARILSNRCIGLVLSGGGLFGLAHIGVIKALEEAGITIDAIGGVSSGSIIAGLYASGLTSADMIACLEKLIKKIKKYRFMAWQIPFVSLIKPQYANKFFYELFADLQIEDLWIHFFSVACNLSTTKDAIFDKGSLKDAVLASNSLPGMLTPALIHGELFVDGGITNTMPVDVMKTLFGGITIAVDVSPKRSIVLDASQTHYPSTFEFILNKLNPFAKKTGMPRITDIITRTIIIGNKRKLNDVKTIVDHLIEPDFSTIKRASYRKMDELIEIGYQTARQEIEKWRAQGLDFAERKPDE